METFNENGGSGVQLSRTALQLSRKGGRLSMKSGGDLNPKAVFTANDS